MSQSRVERVGTVYSRMKALLESGARKTDFRPIWLDVYESFPPVLEPRWDRKPAPGTADVTPPIFYTEDRVRAQFYRQFGEQQHVFDLLQRGQVETQSQKFIQRFRELEASDKMGGAAFDEVFLATVRSFQEEGINLAELDKDGALGRLRRGSGKVTSTPQTTKSEQSEEREPQGLRPPSFRELFAKEDLKGDN